MWGGVLSIANGGSGASNRFDAFRNFAYLGDNPTGSTANDTRSFWEQLGTGYCYINKAGMLNGQPNQCGFLLNIVNGTEVHQQFYVQDFGKHYYRGANYTISTMPSFRLQHDISTIESATLKFPAFTSNDDTQYVTWTFKYPTKTTDYSITTAWHGDSWLSTYGAVQVYTKSTTGCTFHFRTTNIVNVGAYVMFYAVKVAMD